jgi:hypothetical protein
MTQKLYEFSVKYVICLRSKTNYIRCTPGRPLFADLETVAVRVLEKTTVEVEQYVPHSERGLSMIFFEMV